MSETVLILAVPAGVLAVLFGIRVAARTWFAASAAAETEAGDVAGVVALPPVIYLAFLIAAALLEALVPWTMLVAHSTARTIAGAALVVVAFGIAAAAAGRFRAAHTSISTSEPTTALVVDGIYAYTRNPAYVAQTLIYLGLAVAAGSLWAIVLLIPLLWVINTGVIAREEQYLERKFGGAYRAYKAKVRRWV